MFTPTKDDCILYGYRGSHAHGLYIPPTDPMGTDDTDYMGVCIAPIENYFGLQQFEGRDYWDGSDDIVIYELRKFVRLLIKSNPNVLSFLWNDLSKFTITSWYSDILLSRRDWFSSRQAYPAFVGYAKSQLYKMQHQSYMGYMGEKRKALVAKYGYDVKNASHLIRLLTMGEEFLRTGILNVYRTNDRQMLIDIKQGEWSLERVTEYANTLFVKVEDAKRISHLPEYPRVDDIETMTIRIINEYFRTR